METGRGFRRYCRCLPRSCNNWVSVDGQEEGVSRSHCDFTTEQLEVNSYTIHGRPGLSLPGALRASMPSWCSELCRGHLTPTTCRVYAAILLHLPNVCLTPRHGALAGVPGPGTLLLGTAPSSSSLMSIRSTFSSSKMILRFVDSYLPLTKNLKVFSNPSSHYL